SQELDNLHVCISARWRCSPAPQLLQFVSETKTGDDWQSATDGRNIMRSLSLQRPKCVFARAILGISLTATSWGQGVGTIVGTVTDSSGAVIPSATVKIVQTGTGLARSVAPNEQGYFVIPSLQPSQYNVEVTARGFRNFSQKNVTLQADQNLTINA